MDILLLVLGSGGQWLEGRDLSDGIYQMAFISCHLSLISWSTLPSAFRLPPSAFSFRLPPSAVLRLPRLLCSFRLVVLFRFGVAFECECGDEFRSSFRQTQQTHSIIVLLEFHRLVASMHLNR